MMILILYIFTFAIYSSATAKPDTLHMAPIAVVDEDDSRLSQRIVSAFFSAQIRNTGQTLHQPDRPSAGFRAYTFVINIPPNFQRDILAGKKPKFS